MSTLPKLVIVPVATTVILSPLTRPSIVTSGFVNGVPSYILLLDPVVIVTCFGFTFSVPFTFFTFVKYSVLSLSSLSLITYPSLTTFALLPASVWLPLAVASTVKPSGRPLAVTAAFVRAIPSYSFSPLAAVSVTSAVFGVTVSVPRFSMMV